MTTGPNIWIRIRRRRTYEFGSMDSRQMLRPGWLIRIHHREGHLIASTTRQTHTEAIQLADRWRHAML